MGQFCFIVASSAGIVSKEEILQTARLAEHLE
jgi:hypothetical protein